jgi:integral membrane sensor domain MASE1
MSSIPAAIVITTTASNANAATIAINVIEVVIGDSLYVCAICWNRQESREQLQRSILAILPRFWQDLIR